MFALLAGWKLKAILAGLAVVVTAGYVLYLRADAADARADAAQLRANVERLTEANQRTAAALVRVRADAARSEAALVRETERAVARASELSTLMSEAKNAPDDRIAGPVIQRGFDRLRLLDGPGPGGGGDPGGGDPAAGISADLP